MLYYNTGVGHMPLRVDRPEALPVFTPTARGRIAELERRLADARARLPKHSTPMSMVMEIEELEEALVHARAQDLAQTNDDAASNR
jgi:hypothetical protein